MLDLSDNPPDAENTTAERNVAFLGVLLHERHHWLQQVGTLDGVFHTLVLEAQALGIGNIIQGDSHLDPMALPLLADPAPHHLAVFWERAEATRRLFFGCRTGDLQILFDSERSPIYAGLSRVIGLILTGTLPEQHHTGPWYEMWNAEPDPVTTPPVLVRHRGWALGSRHLMEFTARLSEASRLAGAAPAGATVDVSELFTGVYDVVPDFVSEVLPPRSGLAGVERLIVLAAACDLALNLPRPPMVTMDDKHVNRGWTPSIGLLSMIEPATEGTFPSVDARDPESVRSLIDAYYERCEPALGMHPREMFTAIARCMAPYSRSFEGPGDLYLLEGEMMPRPAINGSRIAFHLDQCARAFDIRMRNPELFAFPYCHYAADRAAFHVLYDQIAPPLLRYGDLGPAHTDPPPGWVEYWVIGAIQYTLTRKIVYEDIDGIAAALRDLGRMQDAERAAGFQALIRNTVGLMLDRSPSLADAIIERL